ncbi:MAG: cysteine desulfurase [Clostridia bacterium]|nr:cysteine desulfurase [Clostridia bacterium]
MNGIYLDNSATTPLCEAARARFLAVSQDCWGNPSSLHGWGNAAARELNTAREAIARALGARDGQVVFTGSGSEANNLAILGRAYAKERYRRGARIVTTRGEHASVTMPLAKLAGEGYEVVEIDTVGGEIDMAQLEAALTKNTVLVTVMAVNNETGARYDIAAIARATHRLCPDAIVHTDATQAFMKVPVSPRDGADLITVSAHKIEGPKGCGALWISPAVIKNKGLTPQILGGGQENGLRSGTENVAGCAAFGAACDYARANFEEHTKAMRACQEYLIKVLQSDTRFAEVKINLPKNRAPHIVSLTMPSIKSETMLHFLSAEGIYVSSGSACSSHGRHGAPPLLAFGLSEKEADNVIRVSLSHRNTKEEMDAFLSALTKGLSSLVRIK